MRLLTNMLNINLIAYILLCKVFALTAALGSMGDPGNQWNQNPHQQQRPQQTKGPLGGWDDEVSNPKGVSRGDTSMWKLEDSIPGIPGMSYPNYRKIPDTSFDCANQKDPGYYADVEARCQVYHICQVGGRQNSFLCPIGTIYNQETFVCDWWFNVNCADAPIQASKNSYLYRGPQIGIDGSKLNTYRYEVEQGAKGNAQPPAVAIPDFGSQDIGGHSSAKGLDQSKGRWQQGGNRQGNSWPSQNQDQSQGHRMQGGNQRGGNWASQTRDQFQGQGQRRRNQKGGSWQSQGRDQFPGQRRQGGSQKGGTWPSQVQDQFQGRGQQNGNQKGGNLPPQGGDQSQGQWKQERNQKGNNLQFQSQGRRQQGGNQKGGNRPMNPVGFGGGQNWQNGGIADMRSHQGRGNLGNPDKGSAEGQKWMPDMRWGQQGGNSRGSEKGKVLQQGHIGENNPSWNQKGGMTQRDRGSMKGGQMQPNMPNNFLGNTGMGKGSASRRMGPNRESNSNKGFDANSWSLRPQNFQFPSQDRKGSSSEMWHRNDNPGMVHQKENLPPPSSEWQNLNTNFKGQNRNTASIENSDWSSDNENPLTKRDADDEYHYNQSYNSDSEHTWENNANIESSWQERDYDYN